MGTIAKRVKYIPRYFPRLELGHESITCLPNVDSFLLVTWKNDKLHTQKIYVKSRFSDRSQMVPVVDCCFRHVTTILLHLIQRSRLIKCVSQVDAEPIFCLPHSAEESKFSHIALTFLSPISEKSEVIRDLLYNAVTLD